MSGPTDEPNPNTLGDLQSIVDATNLSIFDEDWKYLFDSTDPSTSNEDWKNIVDQPSSSTSSQVSGTTDKPDSNIPKDQQQSIDVVDPSTSRRGRKRPIDEPGSNTSKYDQQQPMDQAGPSASKQSRKQSTDEPGLDIPDKDWQRLIDEVNSDAFEEWQELFDIAGLNTPSQAFDPIDQVGSSNFDKYQQQPADQPSSSIPDQTQQHPIDATDLNISDQDPQQPIDQSSPSTSSQAPGSTNEPNPSTSDEYWKPLFDIINPNIPSQDPINVAVPSTSSQDQQQPMGQGKSANTVSNQVIVLSERYQRTFNRIKQRLELSEIIQKKKHKECREYAALKFEQWSALAMGEDISGSKYDPDTEKQLKEEYKKISRRVHDVKYELKRFMKRRGLKLEEPN
ncbi:hypothetical protein BATDEDRAFT_90972 [Batrachochytrium dendrobatidis JAM81]|uniref:Uncharacterized protein n=1 Tax=Batrachochytrium dendrobatidis (strain JAM81 / FGSC 10211) TaxID=684364 RepID=F4P8V2_BATDJ|nr:uncharacterized protein BATDEDRAFT_90972 [Batrachochytrium dendrobatidis JAM81]EGF78230.1 hypothetical protein BATDEDRAFT_90972 [Batrachochytrium dendrobatidis JAM81]|eukprot:XP_006681250.1 hypothetical protein BATDEDRAFT_90972 [Batrachochytrium dendrobatidis JAM81]